MGLNFDRMYVATDKAVIVETSIWSENLTE